MPYLLAGAGTGADPATWLFWDDLHPTTRGHERFAAAAAGSLLDTYSPARRTGRGSGAINALNGLAK